MNKPVSQLDGGLFYPGGETSGFDTDLVQSGETLIAWDKAGGKLVPIDTSVLKVHSNNAAKIPNEAQVQLAQRPLPAPLTVRHTWTSHTGVVPAGRKCLIALGARWKLQQVTVMRDGDHVAVYAGNHLIRALDIDPTQLHQPLGKRHPTTT